MATAERANVPVPVPVSSHSAAPATQCLALDTMHPALLALRSWPAVPEACAAADSLQASLRAHLEHLLSAPIAPPETTVSYAMPRAAACVASSNAKLSAFLASATQREERFNVSKAKRMDLHRLIDAHSFAAQLTQYSHGSGYTRELVVRKVASAAAAAAPADEAKIAELQQRRRAVLEVLLQGV